MEQPEQEEDEKQNEVPLSPMLHQGNDKLYMVAEIKGTSSSTKSLGPAKIPSSSSSPARPALVLTRKSNDSSATVLPPSHLSSEELQGPTWPNPDIVNSLLQKDIDESIIVCWFSWHLADTSILLSHL